MARFVIENPSSPASKSIDRLFSWLPLDTTREQVMTGGGARSSSGWPADSSERGESISEIWKVSFRLYNQLYSEDEERKLTFPIRIDV
jgi:hypothetical protein